MKIYNFVIQVYEWPRVGIGRRAGHVDAPNVNMNFLWFPQRVYWRCAALRPEQPPLRSHGAGRVHRGEMRACCRGNGVWMSADTGRGGGLTGDTDTNPPSSSSSAVSASPVAAPAAWSCRLRQKQRTETGAAAAAAEAAARRGHASPTWGRGGWRGAHAEIISFILIWV